MNRFVQNKEKIIKIILIDAINVDIYFEIIFETFEFKSCLRPFRTVGAIAFCRQAIYIYLMFYTDHTFFMFYTFFQTLYCFFLPIMTFSHDNFCLFSLQLTMWYTEQNLIR